MDQEGDGSVRDAGRGAKMEHLSLIQEKFPSFVLTTTDLDNCCMDLVPRMDALYFVANSL